MMTSTAGSRTLCVSDLDRTLLGSDGSVSTESSRVLNAAISDGTLFTYATARSFLSSRRATKALHLKLPLLTYGGTVIADPGNGEPQIFVYWVRASCRQRSGSVTRTPPPSPSCTASRRDVTGCVGGRIG